MRLRLIARALWYLISLRHLEPHHLVMYSEHLPAWDWYGIKLECFMLWLRSDNLMARCVPDVRSVRLIVSRLDPHNAWTG